MLNHCGCVAYFNIELATGRVRPLADKPPSQRYGGPTGLLDPPLSGRDSFIPQVRTLVVSQTAWPNGQRKREKLLALPQPTDEPRKLSGSATLQHSGDPISSSCSVWR